MTHNLSCDIAELRQELAELREAFDSLKSDYLATAGVLHDLRGDYRMHEAVERMKATVKDSLTVQTEG